MGNLHPGFVLRLPKQYYKKLEEIREQEGIAVTQQVRLAVAQYLRGGSDGL